MVRQGIHFDMDTKELKKYYPKTAWRKSYDDIRAFLNSRGFAHEQGSGYHSENPMLRAEALNIIEDMIEHLPWLSKCVRICMVADVPATFDISHMFNKDAD